MPHRLLPSPFSGAALLTLCAGIAASSILAVWLTNVEQNEADLVFQKQAESRLTLLQNGLRDAEDVLSALNGLFAAVGNVSQPEFEAFTQPLLNNYPYVRAFTFQRELQASERAAYEAKRRVGHPGFSITEEHNGTLVPAAMHARYRVVEYIEPLAGNEPAVGLDTSNRASHSRAIAAAAASGKPAATDLFSLVGDHAQHRAFSILMPVYRSAAGSASGPHEANAIRGYTSVVFDSYRLFDAILHRAGSSESRVFDIDVYAGKQADPSRLAFRQTARARGSTLPMLASFAVDRRAARLSETLQAAGVDWRVEIATPPGAVRGSYLGSWAAFLAGLLVSVLGAAYLQLLAMRNARLARTNELLNDDIAARREAERALRRSQAELRELAAHQERVREDERKRIAREIHDDLGQNLLALRLDVTTVEARTAAIDSDVNHRVRIVLSQIDATMKSVRAIINNLRPPVLDLGLQDALEWLVSQFRDRNSIDCMLKIDRSALDTAIDDERATAIFRIVQESLNNVARHARASRIDVAVWRDEQGLFVSVADNGVGSIPGDRRKSRSFGLVGIKERALALGGDFWIDSEPGKGTVVTFSINLEPVAERPWGEERRAS